MGKIISIVNQKGGVAKTTSSINIAVGLGKKGKKVFSVFILLVLMKNERRRERENRFSLTQFFFIFYCSE